MAEIIKPDEEKNVFSKVYERNDSRLYRALAAREWAAIVSAFSAERTAEENLQKHRELIKEIRGDDPYRFNKCMELRSKWIEGDKCYEERSLLIYNLLGSEAVRLGKKYDQFSVLLKTQFRCFEICTFSQGDCSAGQTVHIYASTMSGCLSEQTAREIFSRKMLFCKDSEKNFPFAGKTASEGYEMEPPHPAVFRGPYFRRVL